MTDLMERTPVRDVALDEPKVVLEEPKLEPPVKPSRKEPGVDLPTARGPVRWFHWMIAVLVLIIGATALVVALNDSGTTTVLDTDGSFQAVETQRMQRLAPAVDFDGSFQAVETQRMQRLAPAVDFDRFLQDLRTEMEGRESAEIDFNRFLQDLRAEMERLEPAVVDFDGSFQAVETQRMLDLRPGG